MNALGSQYHRLPGLIPPGEAIVFAQPSLPSEDGGNSGPPPASPHTGQAAGHPLFDLLAHHGHPSALSLASIAELRMRHVEKGHHPLSDANHGPTWFWHGAHEFWWRAQDARNDPALRRKHLVASAAMIVAMIDAEDFVAQQQESLCERQ